LFPKEEWLKFIFDHESPKWQDLLSAKAQPKERRYLASKYFFSIENHRKNIASIPTLDYILKGSTFDEKKVFKKTPLFFKPEGLSQSKGCYILDFKNGGKYNLTAHDSSSQSFGIDEIRKTISNEIQESNYLVQPLLRNEKSLENKLGCKELITMRVITQNYKLQIRTLSALLFIPKTNNRRVAKILRVNINSGVLDSSYTYQGVNKISSTDQNWLERTGEVSVPSWKKILGLCHRAHMLCPNILLVGWDIALTNQGPLLIEGNNAFSLVNHQMDGAIDFLSLVNP
jgi:hypothetical protein